MVSGASDYDSANDNSKYASEYVDKNCENVCTDSVTALPMVDAIKTEQSDAKNLTFSSSENERNIYFDSTADQTDEGYDFDDVNESNIKIEEMEIPTDSNEII